MCYWRVNSHFKSGYSTFESAPFLEKQWKMPQIWGHYSHVEDPDRVQAAASVWPRPGHCDHLGNESAQKEMLFFLSLPSHYDSAFQINRSFKRGQL